MPTSLFPSPPADPDDPAGPLPLHILAGPVADCYVHEFERGVVRIGPPGAVLSASHPDIAYMRRLCP